MVFLILEVEKDECLRGFLDKTLKRFKEANNTVTLAVKGLRIRSRIVGEKVWLFTSLELGVPKLYLLGFLFLALGFLFTGKILSGWLIPSFIFFCLSIFFSSYWLYFVVMLGLKKEGYKGGFKKVSLDKGLCEVVFCGAGRNI